MYPALAAAGRAVEQNREILAAKLRVYELARELGMTNKETLDLCEALGIGVKSHSSSIIDAQADRVRRKAEREGLTRDQQPEEPKPEKPVKKAAAKKAPPKKAAEVAPDAPVEIETPAPSEIPAAVAAAPEVAPAAAADHDLVDAVASQPESTGEMASAPQVPAPPPMTGRV